MAVFLELKAVEKRLKIAFFNKFEAATKRRELVICKAARKRGKILSNRRQTGENLHFYSLLNRVNTGKNKEFILNFKDFLYWHPV